MNRLRLFSIISLFFISSCSNLLTWHLDMGVHKNSDLSQQVPSVDDKMDRPSVSKIKAEIIWDISVNSGIFGNSGYLKPQIINDTMYTVDSDGLISAVSLKNGKILWNFESEITVSSGLSIVDNNVCIGSSSAQLICYDKETLSSNKYIPVISSVSNIASLSEIDPKINIDLVSELAAPVQGINNLFLIKLDNDDLYLLDHINNEIIWKSESQIISLRSKGASMPLVHENKVFIARDNGSIASHNITDGALNWFTIISSRSGRNDLESQRDAEMSIKLHNNRVYYGHFQGELNSLDILSGNSIWSSPFSFISDIVIDNNSIYGSTTDNYLISLDLSSGFLNWKSAKSSEQLTKPFIIKDVVMAFTTEGTLVGFNKDDGTLIYEQKFNLDLHPKTEFINKKDKLFFQTQDGDIVHILITL